MGNITKVDRLPPEQRALLEAEAARLGYGYCEQLAQWTKEQGFAISSSSLARYYGKRRRVFKLLSDTYPPARDLSRSPGIVSALAELGALDVRRDELLTFIKNSMRAYDERTA